MKFLFLESFFGGSHKSFAEGLIAHSGHAIDLLTLPENNWKSRMRSAALIFARRVPFISTYDGIIAGSLISLTDLRAFCGAGCPPILLYFHENQITYPWGEGGKLDPEFGMVDIKNALSADRILFNSETHKRAFLGGLPPFLERIRDFPSDWVQENILSKTGVLHPGCPFPGKVGEEVETGNSRGADLPPLIIWNHRWSFDKNYRDFFHALDVVLASGREFRLALMGDNFGRVPQEFHRARERYGERVVQFGYVESAEAYRNWLLEGTIVVSTSNQENFGISMVEAMRYGCLPLLPDRLSYPEILPAPYHEDHLYRSQRDFIGKLSALIDDPSGFRERAAGLPGTMARFAWEAVIDRYDEALQALAVRN